MLAVDMLDPLVAETLQLAAAGKLHVLELQLGDRRGAVARRQRDVETDIITRGIGETGTRFDVPGIVAADAAERRAVIPKLVPPIGCVTVAEVAVVRSRRPHDVTGGAIGRITGTSRDHRLDP